MDTIYIHISNESDRKCIDLQNVHLFTIEWKQ